MPPLPAGPVYRLARGAARLLTRCFYRRVVVEGIDRVPKTGPVVFVANHPNSVIDSVVIGRAVGRRLHVLATIALFRGVLGRLLPRCGVLPVARKQDVQGKTRDNLSMFDACFAALADGRAVLLFPEGITHDVPALAEVKTGAARIALGAEERNGFRLGLQVVPIGINFPAKQVFRSDAAVRVGVPIRVADYAEAYREDLRGTIRELTGRIREGIEENIVNLPEQDLREIARAVDTLYHARALEGTGEAPPVDPTAVEVETARRIARVVRHFAVTEPELVDTLGRELVRYHRTLVRLGLRGDPTAERPTGGGIAGMALRWGLEAAIGFVPALYGTIHSFLPYRLTRVLAMRKNTRPDFTLHAVYKMLSGALVFPLFYAAQTAVVWVWTDWRWGLAYLISLPVTGIFALGWVRRMRRWVDRFVLARTGRGNRRLLARLRRSRKRLVARLDELAGRYRAREERPASD